MADDLRGLVAFQGNAIDIATPETARSALRQVFFNYLAGFAPTSRVTIRYALSRAAEDLNWAPSHGAIDDVPWHQLTASELSALLVHWRNHLNVSTIRLYMHALRGLARACYIHGLMPSAQYLLLKEVKLPRGRNKAGRGRLVEAAYQSQLLRNCVEDERVQGIRDGAMIALLFASGLRRAELAGLLAENLNLDEGEVKVRAKGGDTVTRYFQAWAVPHLRRWLEYRREHDIYSGPLFTKISKGGKIGDKALTGHGVYYLLDQRSRLAGLPFLVRPHDGRRTLGTGMITEHGELLAQRILGHSDLSTTRIYDKRDDSVIKQIFRDTTRPPSGNDD